MVCFRHFPYTWQIVQISAGLSSIVCACVFFLISVGAPSAFWKIMGGILLCLGCICTGAGAVWCYLSVNRIRTDYDIYGRVKECEVETLTSEAADAVR